MKLGFVQHKGFLQAEEAISFLESKVQELRTAGAQVICTQELFLSPYFCFEENQSHFESAVELNSDALRKISTIAREAEVVLVASIFEKRARGVYHNSIVVFDVDGTQIGHYRKMHIPDDPGFYEKYYFTPGDLGYQVVKTTFGNIGLLICWDQWFPEAARLTAMKGADVILYPTAIGWDIQEHKEEQAKELEAWVTVQRGHAIANGVFVAAINRIGKEEGTNFWGNSFVSDPFGEILYRGTGDQEETVVLDLDFQQIDKYRKVWPYFRDRRDDSYSNITKKFDEH